MRLVIFTQIRENYGEPDMPFWKCKGGEVYILEDVTQTRGERTITELERELSSIINHQNSMLEETVISVDVKTDDEVLVEPWETPIYLTPENGAWKAKKVTPNDEYSTLSDEVECQITEWTLGKEDFETRFILNDGREISFGEYVKMSNAKKA